MSDPTRDYRTVSAETWRKMLRIANGDVAQMGFYDVASAWSSRVGDIAIWVSPGDHPPSWDGKKIGSGDCPQAREYLGGIWAQVREDLQEAVLTLEINPYEPDPALRQPYSVRRVTLPDESEWEWVIRKADELLEMAEHE